MPKILIEWDGQRVSSTGPGRCTLTVSLTDIPRPEWLAQLRVYMMDSNLEPEQRPWLHNPTVSDAGYIKVSLADQNVPPSLRTYLDDLVERTNQAVP